MLFIVSFSLQQHLVAILSLFCFVWEAKNSVGYFYLNVLMIRVYA